MKDLISVVEVFGITLQGEGALAGCPTVFVRTGGCDFRCSWCDSLHAVLPENKPNWRKLAPREILREVETLSNDAPVLITLSGGNPALQPLGELLDLGHERGHDFALETQGSIARGWFAELDHLILSPKPPSSGMRFRGEALEDSIGAARIGDASISIKTVVMDEADYLFARDIYSRFALPRNLPFFITPGNLTPPGTPFDLTAIAARTEWLLERIRRDRFYEARIIPQIHTLLFGNKQGV